jgi:6-phosphogluconolactonase
LYLVVGSLNREMPYFQGARGTGLTVYAFHEATGDATPIAEARDIDNPTFLSVDATSGVIYANSEVAEWREGLVSAYRFDAGAGTLAYLNKQPTLGSITAYNRIAPDRRNLLVANYAEGFGGPDQSIVAFPLAADGSLGPAHHSLRFTGSGVDPARQDRSHAHSIVASPDDRHFIVADLGTDDLILLTADEDGKLRERSRLALPPGSGPRHTEFHPGGRWLFVNNELASTVASVALEDGTLRLIDIRNAIPEGVGSHGADLHVSPDGRFVYSSNRGHDSISTFGVDLDTGVLSPLGQTSTGGKTPRNFAITPSGNSLLVANQNSDSIALFRRDRETGALTDSGQRIAIGTPMCVRVAAL